MTAARHWRALSTCEKLLALLFLFSLPLVNPWVRGDGVGYYAYIRSLLIDHNLRFENEWKAGNPTFLMGRMDSSGKLKPDQYTSTGHLDNHFTVGPAMLWAPFLVPLHLAITALNRLGAHIPADGFFWPYRATMAVATAFYGFLGLCLGFRLARKYVEERWAFLATIGIWFASSLPVYMYFNPSWSHAHSAFGVALFLWYWHGTREKRTPSQWALLGGLSGLMIDVYYPNGILLLLPFLEAVSNYWRGLRAPAPEWRRIGRLFAAHVFYLAAILFTLLPTLVTRQIIYGSPFRLGAYTEMSWNWTFPALLDVLVAPNHGLLSWTPILIPALAGLLLFWKHDRAFAGYLLAATLAFYYVIASYPTWDGLSSFGNRYFVSLTPVFVLGLASGLSEFEKLLGRARAAWAAATLAAGLFIVWNLGFIFQWGTHMVPPRGPISWREMAHNQVAVVPVRLAQSLRNYLVRRQAMMEHIEQEDLKKLQSQQRKGE